MSITVVSRRSQEGYSGGFLCDGLSVSCTYNSRVPPVTGGLQWRVRAARPGCTLGADSLRVPSLDADGATSAGWRRPGPVGDLSQRSTVQGQTPPG